MPMEPVALMSIAGKTALTAIRIAAFSSTANLKVVTAQPEAKAERMHAPGHMTIPANNAAKITII